MELLLRLGLARASVWDPPTLLDRVRASPVRAAAHYLYAWTAAMRGWAVGRQPRPENSLRVVCLADTHDGVVADVPAGDLLVHAGDLTCDGRPADLQRQLDWLAALPHAHKVVVAGNHDAWFDPAVRAAEDLPDDGPVFPPGLHYLQHDARTLAFANGRRLVVYGAPDTPRIGASSAFQYDREAPPWAGTVPADVDVLVTHGPPRHHLDLGLGCGALLAELGRVRPPLHVFGHVHWGAGREDLVWDDAQHAYEALMEDDAGHVLRRLALFARLAAAAAATALRLALPGLPGGGRGAHTVLVNAAQMHGNTGRLGNRVQVVDV